MTLEYIYLMYLREHILLKLPIYKIGRTTQVIKANGRNKRCDQYPKDSIQLAIYPVSNCLDAERHMIKRLKLSDTVMQYTKIGTEYFEGPLDDINDILYETSKIFRIPQVIYESEPDTEPPTLLNPLQCKYCLESFSTNGNFKRHKQTCKEKYDIVRLLEIQLLLDIKLTSGNECRFCDKCFSKTSHCTRHIQTCKAKKEYKEKLEAQVAKTFEFQRLSQ